MSKQSNKLKCWLQNIVSLCLGNTWEGWMWNGIISAWFTCCCYCGNGEPIPLPSAATFVTNAGQNHGVFILKGHESEATAFVAPISLLE